MSEYKGHPHQAFGHVTYAQHGDDLVLVNIFSLLGIEKPSYLDIGAHHPTDLSNTRLLYERGSRGVNVEANPDLISAFFTERPEDINVCLGVAPSEGDREFLRVSPTSGRNTFSAEELNNFNGGVTHDKMPIYCVTLDHIITAYCNGTYPHILSIDIEGLDYDVLQSASFTNKTGPIVIVVETRRDDNPKMCVMMHNKGYNLFIRLWENLFFIRSDYSEKAL